MDEFAPEAEFFDVIDFEDFYPQSDFSEEDYEDPYGGEWEAWQSQWD